MGNWSPKWFHVLAVCVVASLNGGPCTATAATLTGIGMKAPLVNNDVVRVGYRHSRDYDYDDGFDYYRWLSGRVAKGGAYPRYYEDEWPEPVYAYREEVWRAPRRPSSCGEYHYWNGECCVDARFDPPDVGPRW